MSQRRRAESDYPESNRVGHSKGAQPHRHLLVALCALLVGQSPLSTAVIVVDGGCTLPDAIHAANDDTTIGGCTAGDGLDEIRLTGDVVLSDIDNENSAGPNGLPEITSDLVVEGNGFEVRRDAGAPKFRLFSVLSGVVTIRNTTISGGWVSDDPFGQNGFDGGGVRKTSAAELTIEGSVVTGNRADGFYSSGGGVDSNGTLAIVGSAITDNFAAGSGGGVQGGFGQVTVIDSLISGNEAESEGGGIEIESNSVIERTTISDNTAGWAGGGVRVADSLIVDSTISGNEAEDSTGGGIYVVLDSLVELTNSTISGNTAPQPGGGIFVAVYADAVIRNSTIVGNSDWGIGSDEITYGPSGDAHLYGSILSNNRDCETLQTVVDNGGNHDSDGSCGFGAALTGLDPVLRDNGGPTSTHALLPDSSAIGFAEPCSVETDQRGVARSDGACDAGAFELIESAGLTLQVSGSCPEAVTMTMSGATASGAVLLASSPLLGSDVIPQGACTGTALDLQAPVLRAAAIAGPDGSRTLTRNVPDGACGQFVQAIDIATCSVSSVATLPR